MSSKNKHLKFLISHEHEYEKKQTICAMGQVTLKVCKHCGQIKEESIEVLR